MFDNYTDNDYSLNGTEEKIRYWPPLGPGRGSWQEVSKEVKWWLMLHAYGFAISFLVLAFYAFFSILNIRSLITNRPYMSTINVFLCLLSSSRAVCLFIDPYALKDVMPRILGTFVWDLGFPSLISALALLQLALLHLTQIPGCIRILKNSSCLSLAITLHFASVLGIDMTLALHPNVFVLKYIFETIFHIWGAVVCTGFLYAGNKAMIMLKNMPSAMFERDVDAQYKGIMQLAMLAPQSNLASSIAAALVPTLLAPKIVREKKNINQASSSKTEPMKSCILKTTPKPSPNSSDNEDKCTDKRTKKLSWGPEKRITGATKNHEEDNEDVNTSLLPDAKNDLTLDAILNHIAYMNRGGVSETTQHRKQRLKNVLRLTTLTPFLSILFVLISLFRTYHTAWYEGYKKWLAFETFSRSLEVIIAWSMANLTKQPVSNHSLGYQTHTAKQKCLIPCNMLVFNEKFPFVAMMTESKGEKKFHCLGAVVSSAFMMTTCRCIGQHVQNGPNYYDYNIYEPKDYVVNNGDVEYAIEKFEVNSHCAPSTYDNELFYIHDLGGVQIKSQFEELPLQAVTKAPGDPHTDEALNEMRREKASCFIFYLESKHKAKPVEMELTDDAKCAKKFCSTTGDPREKCLELLASILDEGVECSKFSHSDFETNNPKGLASPIVCEDTIWGFASSIHIKYVLWSRVDREPNRNFYEKLRLGSNSPQFKKCLIPCNMLEFDEKFPFVAIMTESKGEKKFHCLGAVVSSAFMMTTCRCIGQHVQNGPNYYDYNIYEPKDYVVNNGDVEYAIEKFEVNSHCAPSTYDNELFYIHDLAGVRIKSQFEELPLHAVTKAPGDPHTDEALNEMRREKASCFIFYLERKQKAKSVEMELTDDAKCAKKFCSTTRDTKEKCLELLASILEEGVECSQFSDSGFETNNPMGLASPIVCEDTIWGFASSIHEKYVLWSRVDREPNRNFYEKLRLGSNSPQFKSDFILQTFIFYVITKI